MQVNHKLISSTCELLDIMTYIPFVGSIRCLGTVALDSKFNFCPPMDNINAKVCLKLREVCNLNFYLPINIELKLADSLLTTPINYYIEVVTGCCVYNLAKLKSAVFKIVPFVYIICVLTILVDVSLNSLSKNISLFIQNYQVSVVPAFLYRQFHFCRYIRNFQNFDAL